MLVVFIKILYSWCVPNTFLGITECAFATEWYTMACKHASLNQKPQIELLLCNLCLDDEFAGLNCWFYHDIWAFSMAFWPQTQVWGYHARSIESLQEASTTLRNFLFTKAG